MNASEFFENPREEMTTNHILLMHKNIPVAEYKIDIDTGAIISNITVLEPEHLPLPVQFCVKNNRLAAYAVNAMGEWVDYCSIPRSRSASLLARYDVSPPGPPLIRASA